jgi:transposase
MTDAEWAEVRAAMPVPAWLLQRGGRPEAYCHREMLDAVRYLVDNGSKWMAMPVDFPYWRAVYDFFRRWRTYDYVRELHERLRRAAREQKGRNAEPSAGIIDSQSVDASETVGEDSRGYDGGKSRDGRKRHILSGEDPSPCLRAGEAGLAGAGEERTVHGRARGSRSGRFSGQRGASPASRRDSLITAAHHTICWW